MLNASASFSGDLRGSIYKYRTTYLFFSSLEYLGRSEISPTYPDSEIKALESQVKHGLVLSVLCTPPIRTVRGRRPGPEGACVLEWWPERAISTLVVSLFDLASSWVLTLVAQLVASDRNCNVCGP